MKAKKQAVSHDEIQKALRAFQHRGGFIKHLPDQVALGQTLVGSKWSAYETGEDVLPGDAEAGLAN